jgi:hypothetical protein
VSPGVLRQGLNCPPGRENIPKDPTAGIARRVCLQTLATQFTGRWEREFRSGYPVARREAVKISHCPRLGFEFIQKRAGPCARGEEGGTPLVGKAKGFGPAMDLATPYCEGGERDLIPTKHSEGIGGYHEGAREPIF